ncbi:hypothetical protein K523DRAFT_421977 [Schizophyllum commune Tattone D]|nr:hypothetical protein K525DRAFT_248712 [Schizophyllum commune Loenen D]KAI5822556.1 hypothetical protein K523DRAFT_421977 [Schizophyllum commune Tattone D]
MSSITSRSGSPEPSGDELTQPPGDYQDPMRDFLSSTRAALERSTSTACPLDRSNLPNMASTDILSGAETPGGSQLPQAAVNNSLAIPPLSFQPGYPALVKRLQDVLALDEEARAFVDMIGNATSFQEIMLIQGAGIAKLNQLSRAATLAEKVRVWAISQALQSNLRFYSRLFLLSHKLNSYRGKNIGELVYKFLRLRNIADLPSETDHVGKKILYSAINDILSNFRCETKKKVVLSLDPDSPLANIADLTAAIISPLTGAVPTLELFARIAFLRFHVRHYGHLDEQLFWRKVDYTLQSWTTSEFKTADALNGAFTQMYHDDQVFMNRRAAESTVEAVDAKDIPSWMNLLMDLGKEVRNNEKLGNDPAQMNAKMVVQRPAKRRRGSANIPSSDA